MKRGIVMSMNDQYAVVMTADGGFLRAPIQGTPQIGEEIIFEQEYRETRRRPRIRPLYGYSGVAAIALILFLPLLFMVMKDSNPIVAYVSMDINPSVEIGVDSHERVRSLRALNKDGEKIISGLPYKGIAVELVAASLLAKARELHYLDVADKDIVITSMVMKGGEDGGSNYDKLLSGKISDTLIERLTELAAESITANITTLAVPSELRDAAAANGVSSGKMAVYLMAKDEGYEIELEQLKHHSIDNVTSSIGGVKTIVDNARDTSKSKLKELVDREKAEMGKKNDDEKKNSQKPSSTPKPAATAKPNGTGKPVATFKNDNKQDGNANGVRKPEATSNNNKKPISTDKAASGKREDNNRGDNDDNDDRGSGDDDDNDGGRSRGNNNDGADDDRDDAPVDNQKDDNNDDSVDDDDDRRNNEDNRGSQGGDDHRGSGSQSGKNDKGDRRQ
ncbi:anti-sigma factor domain-containing protein [Paenibacillus harenae]|uniref:RsgI N-terminal anti-sigma domain-containing protein n=1 Tax=Paenibacillus harenae TaxID=306543 RepID=A0ABT9TUP1_PAEHA|nr:anti-sigma factor domain-containing protein [Paenibacillus harenae]MDQ0111082.1 hypothetical protein [Paenibacillus harenae]